MGLETVSQGDHKARRFLGKVRRDPMEGEVLFRGWVCTAPSPVISGSGAKAGLLFLVREVTFLMENLTCVLG